MEVNMSEEIHDLLINFVSQRYTQKDKKKIIDYIVDLQQKVEQLEKENKKLNNIINKARRKLGEYKYYSTSTEEQNKENEDISEEVYQILHGNLYELKELKENNK